VWCSRNNDGRQSLPARGGKRIAIRPKKISGEHILISRSEVCIVVQRLRSRVMESEVSYVVYLRRMSERSRECLLPDRGRLEFVTSAVVSG
jgi:hypothetical protein